MKSPCVEQRVAVAFCGVIGLYDTLYVLSLFLHGPQIGPRVDVLFPDFLVFHAALRAWIEGKLAIVYDIKAFTHFQNAIYADRFEGEVGFRPFFYPPVWLFMLLPLAGIAVGKAYGVFMTATVAAATWLEGRRDWWGWLAIVTSPAAVGTVLAGQNSFFSVALFYGGLRALDRSPALAGILLGLLAYKPQLWILVPIALIAARRLRAFAWAIGAVLVLSLASLGLLGLDFWRAFFNTTREAGSAHVIDEMVTHMYMQMTTLFAAVRIVGLSTALASMIQFVGSAGAIVAVWLAFRRYDSSDARTAVLVTATFLMSPYTLNYDLLLLMPVVMALFRRGATEAFYPAERLIYLALWLMPTFGLILNRHGLPIAPLVILSFGGIAWLRLRAMPKVELPQAAMAR
ncbi:MAG: DUF2029 domain-containing protein [Proteobacteria bacterium]|nr:DUF2029 domain-containing protein [Pseudomonadota bacterium]